MKKAILLASLLIFSCTSEEIGNNLSESIMLPKTTPTEETEAPSTVETETQEVPSKKLGVFNYSGRIPNESSKIPTCKDKDPAYVHFDLVDEDGQVWTRESPVTESDGIWTSENDSLPVGLYTVTDTYLLSAQLDTVFAIPKSNEPDFHDYADTILPVELSITETPETLTGTAFCYIPSDIPVDGGFGPGLGTRELQTVVFYVTGLEVYDSYVNDNGQTVDYERTCIDLVYFVVDGYTVIERYTYDRHLRYPVVVPVDYDWMNIYSIDDQDNHDNWVQQFSFTRENPYDPEIHGALLFDECDEIEGN